MANLTGTWDGRLIDAAGFEGSINFSLSEKQGKVAGLFQVSVQAQHTLETITGNLTGETRGSKVTLSFETEKGISVKLVGDVFPCRPAGRGLKGRYYVSADRASPLLGGVLCAQQGVTLSAGIDSARVTGSPPEDEPDKKGRRPKKASSTRSRKGK